MKQQVLIIGGGSSYKNYNCYINGLRKREIILEKLKTNSRWKDSIGEKLGNDYEVFVPEMPNKLNARYFEWKIFFEKIIPLLNDKLILVGHSLGGIFLAKYLTENDISKKILGLVLISAPFDKEGKGGETLSDFKLNLLTFNLDNYKQIILVHSQDDKVVDFNEVKKYLKQIPKAELVAFKNMGHFNQKTFPELIKIIRKLAAVE